MTKSQSCNCQETMRDAIGPNDVSRTQPPLSIIRWLASLLCT